MKNFRGKPPNILGSEDEYYDDDDEDDVDLDDDDLEGSWQSIHSSDGLPELADLPESPDSAGAAESVESPESSDPEMEPAELPPHENDGDGPSYIPGERLEWTRQRRAGAYSTIRVREINGDVPDEEGGPTVQYAISWDVPFEVFQQQREQQRGTTTGGGGESGGISPGPSRRQSNIFEEPSAAENGEEGSKQKPDSREDLELPSSADSGNTSNTGSGLPGSLPGPFHKESDVIPVDDKEEEEKEKSSVQEEQQGASHNADNADDEPVNSEEGDEDEEETCNPMVSDGEEWGETEEAYRGDRIGGTVYSERHVLRILMKWVEELPRYSYALLEAARERGDTEETIEANFQQLDKDFEEQMSLLWDMSAETDVMNFLVENKVFTFIRDTIDRGVCHRFTEIALGILANVISEPTIMEDLTVHDSSLALVERVVDMCSKVTNVPVLIQVFSVLRRIVWYLKNVAPVKKWTDLFLSSGFLGTTNFIMASSTNALLLGNVIILIFILLDYLTLENDDGDEERQQDEEKDNDNYDTEKAEKMARLTANLKPFCETEFVPSLCEGLKELMKNPKPPRVRRKLTSTRENKPAGCPTDDHVAPTADEIDVPIPPGHIQHAILNGLSSLALLQKATNGKHALRNCANQVISFLLDFHQKFATCCEASSRSAALEYFSLSLHLLSFCHSSLETVIPEAIQHPVSTASKLMSQEENDKAVDMVIRVQLKDGVEFDSVTYIALVTHEYLASIAERFGPDSALEARNNESYANFFTVLDQVVATCSSDGDTDNLKA